MFYVQVCPEDGAQEEQQRCCDPAESLPEGCLIPEIKTDEPVQNADESEQTELVCYGEYRLKIGERGYP